MNNNQVIELLEKIYKQILNNSYSYPVGMETIVEVEDIERIFSKEIEKLKEE